MIDLMWGQVGWVSGILVIAATIQGVAGFGFMLVAVAGLIQIYPAQLVVPGLALVYIPLGLAQTFQARKQIDLPMLRTWSISALVGMVPGTLILLAFDTVTMKRVIGVVMIVLAVLLRIRSGEPFLREQWARVGVGILSGLLGASTSVAGPPIVLMGIKQKWAVEPFRATLLSYFTVLSVVIVGCHTWFGIVTIDTVLWAAGGLPGIALGFLTATWMRGVVNDENFRRLGVGLVLAGGFLALVL